MKAAHKVFNTCLERPKSLEEHVLMDDKRRRKTKYIRAGH